MRPALASLGAAASIGGGAALGSGGAGAVGGYLGDATAGGYGGLDAASASSLGGAHRSMARALATGASGAAGAAGSTRCGAGGGSLIPGVSNSSLLGLGSTALGALGGAQGTQSGGTSTRTMDPRLDPAVYGAGGIVPSAQGLLTSQLPQAQAAGQQMMNVGSGLLGQPIAGNGVNQVHLNAPTTSTNPYLGGMADDIARRTQTLLGQNNQAIQGAFVGSGGLGGSRQGIAQGTAAGQAADSLQGQLANLYGTQYSQDQNRALQQYGLDQNFYGQQRGQDLTGAGVGSSLIGQGLNAGWQPIQNASSAISPVHRLRHDDEQHQFGRRLAGGSGWRPRRGAVGEELRMVGVNMAGLLGQGFDDPQSSAIMALAGGLLQGNFGAGLLGANSAYQGAQEGLLKRQLGQAQLDNYRSEVETRRAQLAKQQQMQKLLSDSFGPAPQQPAQMGQLGSGSFGVVPPPAGQPMIPQSAQPGAGRLASMSPDTLALLKANGLDLVDVAKLARPDMQVSNGYAYDKNNTRPGFLPQLNVANNGQVTQVQVGPDGQPVVGAPRGSLEAYSQFRNADEAAKAQSDLTQVYNPVTQRMEFVPRSRVLAGAGGAPSAHVTQHLPRVRCRRKRPPPSPA
jgi:hypothetical protein